METKKNIKKECEELGMCPFERLKLSRYGIYFNEIDSFQVKNEDIFLDMTKRSRDLEIKRPWFSISCLNN